MLLSRLSQTWLSCRGIFSSTSGASHRPATSLGNNTISAGVAGELPQAGLHFCLEQSTSSFPRHWHSSRLKSAVGCIKVLCILGFWRPMRRARMKQAKGDTVILPPQRGNGDRLQYPWTRRAGRDGRNLPAMSLTLDLPAEVEAAARASYGDPAAAVSELVLIDLYRRGRISAGRLAETLGLARMGVEDWLAERGVSNSYDVGGAGEGLSDPRRLAGRAGARLNLVVEGVSPPAGGGCLPRSRPTSGRRAGAAAGSAAAL